MSLFELYEPHTEYLNAVMLRPENFDELADELSKWNNYGYTVAKTIRYGEPVSLTISSASTQGGHEIPEPVTVQMYQVLTWNRDGFELIDRAEFRRTWRKMNSDPFK